MASGYTSGPWTMRGPSVTRDPSQSGDYAILAGEPSVIIAETFHMVGPDRFAPSKDNAQLIIAAPDLLAACKKALEDLELWHTEHFSDRDSAGGIVYRGCGGCSTCEETMPSLAAAIAKAEGKDA